MSDKVMKEIITQTIDKCKEIAMKAYYRNKDCPSGCCCGDGYHISMSMDMDKTKIIASVLGGHKFEPENTHLPKVE